MRIRSCFLLSLSFTWGHGLSADVLYGVTDLGDLGGGNSSYVYGINNAGQVTGYANTPSGETHAFLYSNGAMKDLGTLGGRESYGFGINNAGQVTGYANTPSGETHAFLYSNGQMTDLGTLGGTSSIASGINNLGQVVGTASTSSGGKDAFLYSNGQMMGLGLGDDTTFPNSINNAGQITGTYVYRPGQENVYGPPIHAFLYSNGSVQDLGALPGDHLSYGFGINEAGQVTGQSVLTYKLPSRGFLYSDGQMTDLGTLGGYFSSGYAINNLGQVVGYSSTGESRPRHAFLYSKGQMTDLNRFIDPALGITLFEARGINDKGQIVANPEYGPAYLLTPIPEPSAWALLVIGVASVMTILIYRRKMRPHHLNRTNEYASE